MAGQKKKLRYSEETPWFPEYYIGWIGIGNCGQKTSNVHVYVNYHDFGYGVSFYGIQNGWSTMQYPKLQESTTYRTSIRPLKNS